MRRVEGDDQVGMSLDPVRALIAFSAGEPVLPLPEMGQLALTALMTRITQVKD